MSGSERRPRRSKAEIAADKAARAERAAARKALAAQKRDWAATQKAAKAQARRTREIAILDEVRAAKRAGAMPQLHKARAPKAAPAGNLPVLGERSVPDPLDAGKRLNAIVNLAEHPLEMMLARQRLTQAQYEAGVRFRAIYERAMIGPAGAIDPERIKVDGGGARDPLTLSVMQAHQELAGLAKRLGRIGGDVCRRICGEGLTVSELGRLWPTGDAERARIDYVGIRLREVLDVLAEEVWGAKGPDAATIRGERELGSPDYDERAVAVANQRYLRRSGVDGMKRGA